MRRTGTAKYGQTKKIYASVEVAQFLDLRYLKSYPKILQPGWTIECQLALIGSDDASYSHTMPDRIGSASGRLPSPIVSQPKEYSSITHAVGRVISSEVRKYESGSATTSVVETLLEAEGVRFVMRTRTPGDSWNPALIRDDLVQVCGSMFCIPSFCDYEFFSPVRARITGVEKARIDSIKTATIWGVLELEVDPNIRKTILSVADLK